MKSTAILLFALAAAGCSNAPQPVSPNTTVVNAPATNERPQTTIAHSTENQPGVPVKSGDKTKWTQGGEPVDTKELDETVATANKALTAKPADAAAKKALSVAYYKRAVALTDARQYASALGDYRKALKYDAENTEAKDWIDKIIMIYDSMNKDYPKEGEEPPPLPFTKGK